MATTTIACQVRSFVRQGPHISHLHDVLGDAMHACAADLS